MASKALHHMPAPAAILSPGYKIKIAGTPGLTEMMQERLVKETDDRILEALAGNFSITEPIQLILLESTDFRVLEALAGNLHITEKVQLAVFKKFLKSHFYVLLAMAANANTALTTQNLLFETGDIQIQNSLATHTKYEEIQAKIADSHRDNLRGTLAKKNKHLAKSVLTTLSHDGSCIVLLKFTENDSIPEALREEVKNRMSSAAKSTIRL